MQLKMLLLHLHIKRPVCESLLETAVLSKVPFDALTFYWKWSGPSDWLYELLNSNPFAFQSEIECVAKDFPKTLALLRLKTLLWLCLSSGYPDHMVFSEFRRRFDVLTPHLTKKHGRHYIVTDEKRVSVVGVREANIWEWEQKMVSFELTHFAFQWTYEQTYKVCFLLYNANEFSSLSCPWVCSLSNEKKHWEKKMVKRIILGWLFKV